MVLLLKNYFYDTKSFIKGNETIKIYIFLINRLLPLHRTIRINPYCSVFHCHHYPSKSIWFFWRYEVIWSKYFFFFPFTEMYLIKVHLNKKPLVVSCQYKVTWCIISPKFRFWHKPFHWCYEYTFHRIGLLKEQFYIDFLIHNIGCPNTCKHIIILKITINLVLLFKKVDF